MILIERKTHKGYIQLFNDNILVKRECSCCRQVKDVSLFDKNKKAFYGVSSICKACGLDKVRKYKEKIKGRKLNNRVGRHNTSNIFNDKEELVSKLCLSCKIHKAPIAFRKVPSMRHGLSSKCIECAPLTNSKLYIKKVDGVCIERECGVCRNIKGSHSFNNTSNGIGVKSTCKDCYVIQSKVKRQNMSEEQKQYHREKTAKWKRDNQSKASESDRNSKNKRKDLNKKLKKIWAAKNKGKIRSYNSKRREMIKSSTHHVIFKNEIQELYDNSVWLEDTLGVLYHVDHIIPIVHEGICGLHTPANLMIVESTHNHQKSNKWDGTYNNLDWKIKWKEVRDFYRELLND